MTSFPLLIPWPKRLTLMKEDSFQLRRHTVISVEADEDHTGADELKQSIRRQGFAPAIRKGAGLRSIRILHRNLPRHENYRLIVRANGIRIEGATARARYYGVQTLRQLIRQYGRAIPALTIEDAPDFAHRGFMHDVSRGKVPRLETLFELVELLAHLKYNQLQLYIEHTFQFERHPLPGRGHSPLSPENIRALDAHCRKHHIELVPNLQSFGHQWHFLKHPKYHHLAESEFRGGWTLSPEEPGTYQLLRELYEDYLPSFSNREYFNVGCDETYDLGKGKSAAKAAREGPGRVYVDHLLRVHELVFRHGRRMMFWGDIIEKYPNLLGELPRDVVLLNWEYEAEGGEPKYRKKLAPAKKSELEHWVCPGTSAWNSFFFRYDNAKQNLRNMAKAGLWAGANGYLVTDWGDFGHYNFLSFSLWSIAYGADCAWRAIPSPGSEKTFDQRFALQALNDHDGNWIEPLRLLGNTYTEFGVQRANNSAERWLFTGNPVPDYLGVTGELTIYNKIRKLGIKKALKDAGRAKALLERLKLHDGSLKQIRKEWVIGAELTMHACRRLLFHNYGEGDGRRLAREIRNLSINFRRLWLERNRKSDLEQNMADMKRIEKGYRKREKIIF